MSLQVVLQVLHLYFIKKEKVRKYKSQLVRISITWIIYEFFDFILPSHILSILFLTFDLISKPCHSFYIKQVSFNFKSSLIFFLICHNILLALQDDMPQTQTDFSFNLPQFLHHIFLGFNCVGSFSFFM